MMPSNSIFRALSNANAEILIEQVRVLLLKRNSLSPKNDTLLNGMKLAEGTWYKFRWRFFRAIMGYIWWCDKIVLFPSTFSKISSVQFLRRRQMLP
jgi:hypothetical protein